MLVVDDSGDRKDGVKAAQVGRRCLGRYGKADKTDPAFRTKLQIGADLAIKASEGRVCVPRGRR